MAKSKEDRVREAEDAHENGKPLPPGVSFNPYRSPRFLAIEDDPEFGGTLKEDVRPVEGATPIDPQTL